jgi:DNA-directed RNA polymerase specialized sigma24 family protein
MGSNRNFNLRVEPDSPPSQPNNHKQKDLVHAKWITAASLRPNTQRLAERCMDGDPEAIAIRDAWAFQTSRATRIITVPADDPMFGRDMTLQIEGNPKVAPLSFDRPRSKELDFDRSLEQEEVAIDERAEPAFTRKEQMKGSTDTLVIFRRESAGLDPKQKEKALEALLDRQMATFSKDQELHRQDLWDAVFVLAMIRAKDSYKQLSLRVAGTEEDMAHEFCLHAMNQIDEGMYSGTGLFSGWIKKVYRNFANTALNTLTKDKKKYCGLQSPDDNPDGDVPAGEGMEVQKGYVSSDQMAWQEYSREQGRQFDVKKALEDLSPADQAYAALLSTGLSQTDAAEGMEESVVTSRKRETRIRAALVEVAE